MRSPRNLETKVHRIVLGHIVRGLRGRAGLTQAQLAGKLGCLPSLISFIELAKVPVSSVPIHAILHALGYAPETASEAVLKALKHAESFVAKLRGGEHSRPERLRSEDQFGPDAMVHVSDWEWVYEFSGEDGLYGIVMFCVEAHLTETFKYAEAPRA